MNDEPGWTTGTYDSDWVDAGAFQVSLTTTESADSAEELARGLVRERLAASVQIAQVHGIQSNNGEIQSAAQWQLWIKTTDDREEDLHRWISEHHPHERPELVSFPVTDVNPSYAEWVIGEMKG